MQSHENELGQVFLAILNNAVDAFAEAPREERRVVVRARRENERVVVRFCDTAGGIPAGKEEIIFEPYFSTKEERNGTGLGLYMAKMIIDTSLSGSIEARNEGGGACFAITLPVSLTEEAEA